MKYWGPINSTGGINGNDGYLDGNATTGQEGSIPSFSGFEQTLRALSNLVASSGRTPGATINDFQFTDVVRSQRVNWVGTFGGTANALTVTLDPPPANLAELIGVPIRGKFGLTNTIAAVTLSVNGLTAPVTRPAGAPLVAGDLAGTAIGYLLFDGAQFQAFGIDTTGAAGLGGSQIYSTPGTFTFTVPAGVTAIFVQGWGSGGSGAVTSGSQDPVSGGGGGGAYREGWLAVTPGAGYTVTVGAGGAERPANSGLNGLSGSSSSFGSFITCGGGGAGSIGAATPGPPGTGSGGQFGLSGCPGEDWGSQRRVCNGGQGGFGGGAGGLHGVTPVGQAPGGGGGGGNLSAVGGAGASGMIIVRW